MSRYIRPNGQSDGARRFDLGARPADELLPPSMVTLLAERDKLMTAMYAARQAVGAIAGDDRDLAAAAEDAATAAAAARKGEPIPEPTAVPQLSRDRAAAVRALVAQESAFAEVRGECASHASELHHQRSEGADKLRAKARAEVAKAADKLADAVEAAVAAVAVEDWLAGHFYEPLARLKIYDVLPAESRVQDLGPHLTGADFPARTIITNAATTVLEES